MTFEPGRTIILREVSGGEVWAERPVRVVRDDDLVALWLPRGTRWRKPMTLNGDPWRIPIPPWKLGDAVWNKYELLQLIPQDGTASYAAWASWDEEGRWSGWYINLQQPLRRVDDGFEYLDLALDLLLLPDGSHRWKDEDEFEEFVERGLISPEESRRVRSVAETVLEEFQRGIGLFGEGWNTWRAGPRLANPRSRAGGELAALRGGASSYGGMKYVGSVPERLPFLDRHEITIATSPLETWIALGRVLDSHFSGAMPETYSRLIGCHDTEASGPRPFGVGSTLVGFHIASAKPPRELVLEGAHRFSNYRLAFTLDRDGEGSTLNAETHASFPGFTGSVYRAAVVGTHAHALLVKRMLGRVKSLAESR